MDGGGNANVFVAENARGEEVAIKILREESGNGKKAVKRNRKKRIRFKIETEMVVGIQDEIKGVIPIFSYGLPDEKTKKYWYAMPIAIPLEDKLKEVKSLEDKVNCVLELARTLEALHKKDIVHRDIKPKNIYFYNGKYCLGDFGLVDYPEKRDLTSLQEAVGPKATMAPEMRYNAKNADGKKADVYSLAKTLWIVLTGVDHIFTEEEIKEVLRAGNDFRNNRLVIDEEGYAQLIDSDLHYECYRYPVSQESYDARNNYVGQYANLDDVGEIYLAMLDGWLHHLRTGQRYDVDYYDQCEDAEKMLAEIKQYYQ